MLFTQNKSCINLNLNLIFLQLLEEAEEAKSELSFHLEENEETSQMEPGALVCTL